MTWTQTLVIGWLQFVIAGTLLLVLARLAMRWMPQPVDRIRSIQITLLAILAVPLLLVVSPVPIWRLGLLHSPGDQRPVESGIHPIPSEHLLSEVTPEGHLAESGIDNPPPLVRSEPRPVAAEPPLPNAGRPLPVSPHGGRMMQLDAWTLTAIMIGLLHVMAVVFFLFEWAVGAARLRRLCRSATAAPAAVISLWQSVSAGRGGHVRLLISSTIDTPLTFGWWRPVIIVPRELVTANGPILRYCLSHEFSHIERGDMLVWNGVWACQFALWYQPLFWNLWRELRICQDILADNRSTSTGHDAIEYSELLMSLARKARRLSVSGALTFFDHPGQLTRRIRMLLEHQTPLPVRSTWRSTLITTTVAMCCAVVISCVRLDAVSEAGATADQSGLAQLKKTAGGQLADSPENQQQDAKKTTPTEPDQSGKLIYHCIAVDKETGKPVPNVKILVGRWKTADEPNGFLEKTQHTTDAEGKYTVEFPPAQVTEKSLLVGLEVEHDDYAISTGLSRPLAQIRDHEKYGKRPFFERLNLTPAQAVTGTILSPQGVPLEGIEIHGLSIEGTLANPGPHSFTKTVTMADGTFRLKMLKRGDALMTILPKNQAIVSKFLAAQRGDLGKIRLEPGVRVVGHILSADGKPLSGVVVNISSTETREIGGKPFMSLIQRGTISDSEGRYAFDPLPAGVYRLTPDELFRNQSEQEQTRRPLPGVFNARTLKLLNGTATHPQDIMAIPHVHFKAQWIDSKGQKVPGFEFTVSGQMSGEFWYATARPDAQGTIDLKVPRGIKDVVVAMSSHIYGPLRCRRSKGGSTENETLNIRFGTLNDDLKDFEIIRYREPIVEIAAIDEQQRPIKTLNVSAKYDDWTPMFPLRFEQQVDGRYRALNTKLLPGEAVKFLITAAGYQPATEIVKLAEGETKELVVKLKRQ